MKKIFVTLALLLVGLNANAQVSYSRYDVNGDHEVNVTDVTTLVNIILGSDKSNCGDVNGDNAVNVTDVTTLVDFILGNRVINGHEYMDLGLPSGTLWATQNMGANSPDEAGDYYAWGETETKTTFSWSNYALANGSSTTLTRYNNSNSYGVVDNQRYLWDEDDAAHVQWGGLWRMPTVQQVLELRNNCTWVNDTARGGYVVTGPNGNSIFIPQAGYMKGPKLTMSGVSGYYWTSALGGGSPYNAYCMMCDQTIFEQASQRCYGRSIRPVAK